MKVKIFLIQILSYLLLKNAWNIGSMVWNNHKKKNDYMFRKFKNNLIRVMFRGIMSFHKSLRLFSTMKYTKKHEWVSYEEGSNKYKIGITDFAQSQLGEIIYIQFESLSKVYDCGETVATIESVKTTAELNAPGKGKFVEINKQVQESPSLINEMPEKSWIFELVCEDMPENLLSKEEYEKFVEEEEK